MHEFGSLHRFAAYERPSPDVPRGAVAVGLRHEATHAAQFDAHGPALVELESILRRAMRRRDRMGDYTRIPSERDATRAAAAYARARYAEEVAAIAADVRYAHFVDDAEPVVSLVDETVEMIWHYVEPDEIDNKDPEERAFETVVAQLRERALGWVPIDPQHRPRRDDGVAFQIRV